MNFLTTNYSPYYSYNFYIIGLWRTTSPPSWESAVCTFSCRKMIAPSIRRINSMSNKNKIIPLFISTNISKLQNARRLFDGEWIQGVIETRREHQGKLQNDQNEECATFGGRRREEKIGSKLASEKIHSKTSKLNSVSFPPYRTHAKLSTYYYIIIISLNAKHLCVSLIYLIILF